MSVFDNDNKHVKHPPEILEFIIERIKLRKTQKRIIQNVKTKFNVDITEGYITRTRRRYEKLTNEKLPISYVHPLSKELTAFTIEQLRQGIAPRFILQGLKDKFNFTITKTYILRIRRQHQKLTGEYIPTYKQQLKLKE
jgi:uncharacterized protein YlxP (DUF503 family)